MGMHQDVTVRRIFNAESIAASGTADSEVFDFGTFNQNGQFSIHVYVAGGGSVTFTCLQANNADSPMDYVTGNGVTAVTHPVSGGTSNGIYSMSPVPSRFGKFRATASSQDAIVVTAFLGMQ